MDGENFNRFSEEDFDEEDIEGLEELDLDEGFDSEA